MERPREVRASAGQQARQAAVRRLCGMYADDFAELLREERRKRGLPADQHAVAIARRLERARERLAELERELDEAQAPRRAGDE